MDENIRCIVVKDTKTSFLPAVVAGVIYSKLSPAALYLKYGREFDISESGELIKYQWKDAGYAHVVIPSGVTSIGDRAFYCYEGLRSVTIPGNVTSTGINAFSDCTALTEVNIPSSVRSISSAALFGCAGITTLTFAKGVIF
jgi:hypothetical protein